MSLYSLLPLIFYNCANFFFNNLANSFISYELGKVLYGHFMLSMSLLAAVAPILLAGNYYVLVEKVPQHIVKKNRGKLATFLHWSLNFLIKCLAFTAFLTLLLLFAQLAQLIPCHLRVCSENSLFYVDALYFAPLYMIMLWNFEYLLTLNEPVLGTILSVDMNAGILIYLFSMLVGLAPIIFSPPEHAGFLIYFFLAQLLLIIIQYITIYIKRNKALSTSLLNCLTADKLPATEQSNLLIRSFTFIPCEILSSLVGISVVCTIEFMHPIKDTLSNFYISGIIASVICTFTQSIQTNMWCLYSLAGTPKNSAATQKLELLLRTLVAYGGLWLIISMCGVTIIYPYVVDLYGIKTPDMLTAVYLQMLYYYLSTVLAQPENILAYHDKKNAIYIGNTLQLITQVTVCYSLINNIGFVGGVVAQIAGAVVCSITCFTSFKIHRIKIKPFGYF